MYLSSKIYTLGIICSLLYLLVNIGIFFVIQKNERHMISNHSRELCSLHMNNIENTLRYITTSIERDNELSSMNGIYSCIYNDTRDEHTISKGDKYTYTTGNITCILLMREIVGSLDGYDIYISYNKGNFIIDTSYIWAFVYDIYVDTIHVNIMYIREYTPYTRNRWIHLSIIIVISLLIFILTCIVTCLYYLEIRAISKSHDLTLKNITDDSEKTTRLLNRISDMDSAKRQIFNLISDMIIVSDITGRILYTNNVFYTVTRYTSDTVRKGLYLDKIFPVEERGFYINALSCPRETHIRSNFNQTISCVYSTYQISVSSGSFSGDIDDTREEKVFVLIVRDISLDLNSYKSIDTTHEFDNRWNNDIDGSFKRDLLLISKKFKNEENIYFLQDVERYRSLVRFDHRIEMQDKIVDLYLNDKSTRQINIIYELRLDILDRIKKDPGDIHLFDNLYNSVKHSVITECYPYIKK